MEAPLEGIHTSFCPQFCSAVTPLLRRWDRKAAASASEYYTTSAAISDEISSVYGIQPRVIPPPTLFVVDGPWERPGIAARDEFFLVVSRLLPYKNLDRVFGVFSARPDLELVVVGTGPLLRH